MESIVTAVSVYQVTLEVNVRPTLMTALQILASMAAAARYKKQEERNINGISVLTKSYIHFQDRVNGFDCQCASGYYGDQCETETDECASNPCQNAIRCHVSQSPSTTLIIKVIELFILLRIGLMATFVSVELDTVVPIVKVTWMNVPQVLV